MSLYEAKIAWGSDEGVYYWDPDADIPYIQVAGYTLTSGFSPAPDFPPLSGYLPISSVSLYEDRIAWGSDEGVYYWNRYADEHPADPYYTQIAGAAMTPGFFPTPDFPSIEGWTPATSVSLNVLGIAWGSDEGVYYWQRYAAPHYTQIAGYTLTSGFLPVPGFPPTDGYERARSVSSDVRGIAWGSEAGVYYWDKVAFAQIAGQTLTSGFSPAPGFMPDNEYSPAASVSFSDSEIAWGSETGVYYWDGTGVRRMENSLGDINADGVIDLTDLLVALQILSQSDPDPLEPI